MKTPALAVGDGFQLTEAESLDSAENRGHGLPVDATVGTYRAPLGPNPKQLDGGPGAAPRRPAGHAPGVILTPLQVRAVMLRARGACGHNAYALRSLAGIDIRASFTIDTTGTI